MVLALVGGGIGLGLAKAFTLLGDPTNGMLPVFYLAPEEILGGAALAVGVGAVSGLVPGLAAVRMTIVGALRGV